MMREATTVDPDNPDNWVVYGQAQAGNGDTEGAIRAMKKALALNPKHANAQNFPGNAGGCVPVIDWTGWGSVQQAFTEGIG